LPLQYVFADHWLVNAWIVDEETRSQPSRLWLTLLIDAYSRSILGMALLVEEPCIESIQSALRHAIWHKSSHTRLGLDGEWSCYGIPQQLFLDNAWAHHSHSLEHLARAISREGVYNAIDLVFRPPYKGRYGAIIERVFRNFSGQLKELVDSAAASKSRHDMRTAAGRACLLSSDLDRLLHRLILTYQHSPHRELGGITPHQKWCEGIQTSGLPIVPAFTPEMDRLFLRMHPQSRQVRSRGIPAFGLNYWSAELGGIERCGRDGSPVRYHFRYDPTDISRISLFRDGAWVGDGYAKELQRADGTYRQVSLDEWKTARHLVAAGNGDAEGKTPAELALVTDLEALSKQRAREKRAAQRTGSKGAQPIDDRQRETTAQAPKAETDEETQRVLRFLYH
jgi:putative transposase